MTTTPFLTVIVTLAGSACNTRLRSVIYRHA
jgi:hypothetical protein